MTRARSARPYLAVSRAWFLLLLASLLVGAGLAVTRIAQPVSNLIHDGFARASAPVPSDQIIIIAIDDPSIAAIGHWPWSRTVHARLIDRLAAAHARTIVYDVLFTEPSAAKDDDALARSIHDAPQVILPAILAAGGADGTRTLIDQPIAPLIAAGAKVGHAEVRVDNDGVLRHATLMRGTSDGFVAEIGQRAAGSASAEMPLLRFASRGAFRTVSFAAVLAGEVPEGFFRDKIVLVGATASGLGDRYATPVNTPAMLTPGIETIANLVSNMIDHRLVTDSGPGGAIAVLIIPLLLLAVGVLYLTPLRAAVLMAGLAVAMMTVSLIGMCSGWWVDPAPGLIVLGAFFPVWGWYRLESASQFIDHQLAVLASDISPFRPRTAMRGGGDRLAQRVSLLDRGISRALDLRAFIRSSFERLPDATLVIDGRGRIVLASARARAIYADYCAVPVTTFRALTGALGARMRGDWDKLSALLAGAEAAVEIAMDDDRFFSIGAVHFNSVNDRTAYRIIRVSEITERMRAERAQQEALEFLSHDIRAPQASMINLLDSEKGMLDGDLRAALSRLAGRTLSLTQDFLDLARVRAGRFETGIVNLGDCLIETVDLLWAEARARSITIEVGEVDEDMLVTADPQLIARAMFNLLQNAVRFSPENGTVGARIVRRIRSGQSYWLCQIDDHGPGIDPGQLSTIFDRFTSGNRASGGVGLGLSLVRAVAESFDGTINCYSRLGLGSRFALALPNTTA